MQQLLQAGEAFYECNELPQMLRLKIMDGKYTWEILGKLKNKETEKPKNEEIINTLLENRGLKTKKEREEFLNPKKPVDLELKELGINEKSVNKAINRIQKAIEEKEQIIIYGDYDADGICATAILWETLYSYTKNVLPHIPDRFSEGYGINPESISTLKSQLSNLKLIITVDNGIVANEAAEKAKELGIDLIITDHHQKLEEVPVAHSIVHTDKISGSGVAWILVRELTKKMKNKDTEEHKNQSQNSSLKSLISKLELAAIGTIADQLPLTGSNRSIAKYGLEEINNTDRPGLFALFNIAGLSLQSGNRLGTYEVNFQIAPRINAMGRLEKGIESLRLLCTKNNQQAEELARKINKVNLERQKVVDQVLLQALGEVNSDKEFSSIVLAHESYHEGVIGLAAGKLCEKYYRPSIVISKGNKESKASARSIPGFNIIETIRKLDTLIIAGGGHPMAAGFSILTEKIEEFSLQFEKISNELLTDEMLQKKIKIDLELPFESISFDLLENLKVFDPTGIGNYTPLFVTNNIEVTDARAVGAEGKHLKLTLKKDAKVFDAIAFGKGEYLPGLLENPNADVVYSIEENTWNGNTKLQLKVKDLKL